MPKPRNPGGRPSKFTPQAALWIVAEIASGTPRDEAARSAGVGASTLYRWLQRGRSGDARFVPLVRAVQGAANGSASTYALAEIWLRKTWRF